MTQFTLIIDGVSGSAYGMRLVEQLLHVGEVTLVFTGEGARITEGELGCVLPQSGAREAVLNFLNLPANMPLRVVLAEEGRFSETAQVSCGSAIVIAAPMSMSLAGSAAIGRVSNEAERAIDTALRKRHTLVLVPCETPFSLIHLRSLTILAESGAVILPAMPEYCKRPESVDDIVNCVVAKVLDVAGIEHTFA